MRVELQDFISRALQVFRGVCLMAAVALMIIGARTFVANNGDSNQSSTEPPPVQPLEVQYGFHDYKCEADEKVVEAVADVRVIGGEPPYRYETTPGDLHYAEFQLPESGIQFRIEGGQTVSVKIRSATTDGEPSIIRDISAPRYLVDCVANVPAPTPTPTSTPTPTFTDTPTPTATSTPTSPFLPGPTGTKDPDDPRPTRTPTVNPTSTRGSTPTDGPAPTDKPTSTERPTATDRPTHQPTSVPKPTSTRKPTPTSPPPPPTSTPPPPPPNRAECEDGRDNDGDGYTDMQDPQCRSRNDNHEDK